MRNINEFYSKPGATLLLLQEALALSLDPLSAAEWAKPVRNWLWFVVVYETVAVVVLLCCEVKFDFLFQAFMIHLSKKLEYKIGFSALLMGSRTIAATA